MYQKVWLPSDSWYKFCIVLTLFIFSTALSNVFSSWWFAMWERVDDGPQTRPPFLRCRIKMHAILTTSFINSYKTDAARCSFTLLCYSFFWHGIQTSRVKGGITKTQSVNVRPLSLFFKYLLINLQRFSGPQQRKLRTDRNPPSIGSNARWRSSWPPPPLLHHQPPHTARGPPQPLFNPSTCTTLSPTMTATSHHCPNTTDRRRGCERADKRMGDGRTHSQIQGGGARYCPPLLHHQFQLTQMPATLPDHPDPGMSMFKSWTAT